MQETAFALLIFVGKMVAHNGCCSSVCFYDSSVVQYCLKEILLLEGEFNCMYPSVTYGIVESKWEFK